MYQYSTYTTWYYINKKDGKIYATKMLFSDMVKRLGIQSNELDIIGSIYRQGNYIKSTL